MTLVGTYLLNIIHFKSLYKLPAVLGYIPIHRKSTLWVLLCMSLANDMGSAHGILLPNCN